jgi:16S rRNA (guanine(966)-N(2))-methyltransferase RsmD
MRIIAGAHKGRTLKTPTWDGLRPTSDRVRETLFNVLAPRIDGANVLDVFAGTGAVALEALSRGARSAVCVESNRRAGRLILENRARLGEAEERCRLIAVPAERVLKAPIDGGPFDIVFLDPPYDYENLAGVLDAALSQRASGGVMIVEHASRRTLPPLGATVSRTLRAGDTSLSFYA